MLSLFYMYVRSLISSVTLILLSCTVHKLIGVNLVYLGVVEYFKVPHINIKLYTSISISRVVCLLLLRNYTCQFILHTCTYLQSLLFKWHCTISPLSTAIKLHIWIPQLLWLPLPWIPHKKVLWVWKNFMVGGITLMTLWLVPWIPGILRVVFSC